MKFISLLIGITATLVIGYFALHVFLYFFIGLLPFLLVAIPITFIFLKIFNIKLA